MRYAVVKELRGYMIDYSDMPPDQNPDTQYADCVFNNKESAVTYAKNARSGSGTDTYNTFVYEVDDSFVEGEIPTDSTLIYES